MPEGRPNGLFRVTRHPRYSAAGGAEVRGVEMRHLPDTQWNSGA
jgi:hypothetical protein